MQKNREISLVIKSEGFFNLFGRGNSWKGGRNGIRTGGNEFKV